MYKYNYNIYQVLYICCEVKTTNTKYKAGSKQPQQCSAARVCSDRDLIRDCEHGRLDETLTSWLRLRGVHPFRFNVGGAWPGTMVLPP